MAGAFIECAKKAVKLFMQSLPVGSSFSIVSFGNVCQLHLGLKRDDIRGGRLHLTKVDESCKNPGIFEYNQRYVDEANAMIDGMEANYGGTKL
jgi:hypothetical protein